VFLGTAPDPQRTEGSSSARLVHTRPINSHHQAGLLQLGSCGYYSISASPTAVRAKCRRSTRLLNPDVRAGESTASAAALAARPEANLVPVVCSACWHTNVRTAQHGRIWLTSEVAACRRLRSVNFPMMLVPSTR